MTGLLYRLGRGSAAHPWRVLLGWAVAALIVFGLAAAVGGPTQDDWDLPDAPSQRGLDLLREHVPGAGNADAKVVVHGDAAIDRDVLASLAARLEEMPHATTVSDPRLSSDGDTAVLEVGYDVPVTNADLYGNKDALDQAIVETQESGYRVELTGQVPDQAQPQTDGRGEIVGVLAAVLILVLVFGSVVSAGLPIVVALVGLAIGGAGLTILAGFMDVSTSAPTVATMVGLGVGIDYALLLVTRHAEFLAAGHDPVDAAGLTTATAGRAVLFAALTVLVSLMGLRLAGMQTYSAFGFATAMSVLSVAAAALTVVPVLCRFAGRRVLPRRVRRGTTVRPAVTARWAAVVGRHPLPFALGAAVVMLLLAAPALDMRTFPGEPGDQVPSLTTRQAHDLVADELGPGANADYVVVAPDGVGASDLESARTAIADLPGVASVSPAQVSPDGAVTAFAVEPDFTPSDERTPGLVDAIRETLPEGAELSGETPFLVDLSQALADRLWRVILFVVLVSMLLLAAVFRSVVIPVKAAVMNLLSVAAAYGVMTAVFQWGWGRQLFGLDHDMPISSWLPILIFAVLFGLSMDYEVFLMSRVRERWLETGDAAGSVVRGLSDTGRVISAAAAIMVAVFLGFASEIDVMIKQVGLGMAVAIALDATLVRMVLVPSTMAMLGRRAWWMPAWLDRILPRLRVDDDATGPAADPQEVRA